MKNIQFRKMRARSLTVTRIGVLPGRWATLIVVILMGSALVAVGVRAYNHRALDAVRETRAATRVLPQVSAPRGGRFYARLSHQPEAELVRRSLGQRFLGPGRERAILIGTLSIGTDLSAVRIVRTQTDDGERVEIAIGAGTSSLVWTPKDGALADAQRALGGTRAIIERLALDSPDEFVLAQLRGASYYTVARNVMPKGAAGSDDYAGPTWDVVRVGEPEAAGPDATLSKARAFHINTSTGLIDRCYSQEQGEIIVAEFSGWADRLGEKVPTQITWNKNGQVIMQLSLVSVAHGPRQ